MNRYIERMLKEFNDEFKRKKKFGLVFVSKEKEPYPFNIGKTVEIVSGGPSFLGVYRGLKDKDEEDLVLYPFAMPQTIPESVVTSDDHGKVARIYQWSDRPALIIRERVCMLPVDENYLFGRVEQARELRKPGIILPDQVSDEDWRKMIRQSKGGKK